MARKVFLTSDIGFDEKLDQVAQENPTAALMWPWLLTYFDDWGRASASPSRIRRQVFSAFAFSDDAIREALQLYAHVGLILLYPGPDGRDYIAIPRDKWFAYQTHIRAEKRDRDRSKYPAPSSSAVADATGSAGSRADARLDAQPRVPARHDAPLRASPSPSPSLSPSPSPVEPPPQEATPPGPPRAAGGDGPVPLAAAAAADQAEPVPRRARAGARAPRLPPDLRRLVGEWRVAVAAEGVAPPRDWHLRAGGYVRRWVQAGATLTDLRAWWAWLHEDPWWATRYPEVALWDRAWSQWRLRAHAPPRGRPPGELSGAAAVDALLAGLARQEGGRDDPG
jgi:hypothetical protein